MIQVYRYNNSYEQIKKIGLTYNTSQMNNKTYGFLTKIARGDSNYHERHTIYIITLDNGLEIKKGLTSEKIIYEDANNCFKVKYGVNGKRVVSIHYLNPFNTKVIDYLGNITYYGFDANLFSLYECNEKGYIKSYNLNLDYQSIGVSNIFPLNPSYLGDNLFSDPYNNEDIKWCCDSTNIRIKKVVDTKEEYDNISSLRDSYNPNMLYGIIGNKVIDVSKLNQTQRQEVLVYFEEDIKGEKNEVLVYGYWLCPYIDLMNKESEFEIAKVTIKLLDSNNNIVSQKEKIIKRKSIGVYDCKWNRYYRDWMYVADYIESSSNYTKIRAEVKMLSESGDINVTRLTGFTLRKKSYGTYLKINETGKLEEYLNNNVSYGASFTETDEMKIEALNSNAFETKKDSKNRVIGTYSVFGAINNYQYNSVSNISKAEVKTHGSNIYSEEVNEYNLSPTQTKDEFITKQVETDGSSSFYTWNKTHKTLSEITLDTTFKNQYTYDTYYRMRKVYFSKGNNTLSNHTLSYDERDNIKTIQDTNKLYTFSYNEDSGLVSVKLAKNSTETSAEVISLGYDNDGFQTSKKYGVNGDEYIYSYTKTGKIAVIKEKKRSGEEIAVAYFEYDDLDRLKKVTNGNHLLIEEVAYDEGNQVASIIKYNDQEEKQFEKYIRYNNDNSFKEAIIKVKDKNEYISYSGLENSLTIDNRSKLFNLKYFNAPKESIIASCLFSGVTNDATYFYGKKETPLVYTYKALTGVNTERVKDNGKWCIDNKNAEECLSYQIDINSKAYPKTTIGMYFKIDSSVTGTLFSLGKTGDNHYVSVSISGSSLVVSIKSKVKTYDDLVFSSKINIGKWNYVSFGLNVKKIGGLKNMEYNAILNGESKEKSYLDVDYEFANDSNILYIGKDVNNNKLNAKIGPIMFTKGAYLYTSKIEAYKQDLDLLLAEIDGDNHFHDKALHEEAVYTSIDLSLDSIYPLRKDLRATNGRYPLDHSLLDNGICNTSNQFVLNEEVSKRLYNAIGSKLVYRFFSSETKTVIMNVYLYTESKNRYLFETKGNNISFFGIYINENNYLVIKALNQTITTSIIIDNNVFTKLHFEWTKSSLQNTSYSVKIYKDGISVYNGIININSEVNESEIYIGTDALGNNPLYGQIEMLVLDDKKVYQSASKKIYSITRSKDYNCLGLLLEESLSKTNKFITKKNEYEVINNKLTKRVSKQIIKCNNTEEVYEYTYNKSERTIEEKKNNVINRKYFYDTRGFLIKENINALDKCIEYTIDNNGNITLKKETKLSDGTIINTQNYSYNMDLLIDNNGNNYNDTYILNPTNLLGYNYVWFGNRLKEITKGEIKEIIEYNYDGSIRVKRIYKNNTLDKEIKYHYDEGKLIYEEGSNIYFIYDKEEIVGIKYLGNTYYYVKDIFGAINKVCDEEGKEVLEYTYDAYGNILEIKGSKKNTLGKVNPIVYKGYYYDFEIELYWLTSRYYSPKLGRFISPDSIEYLDYEIINGLNLYCYCMNNPVMYFDPTGHFTITTFLISLAIGTSISWGLSEIFGSQIAGGISSTVSCGAAIYTGIGLLSFGPVGWIAGGTLILIGAGTMAFGVNEIIAGATGTNYIQSWTGMSDGLYNGLYIWLNIASDIGIIAGNMYMKYNPRYPGNNPNRIPDGFNDRVNPKANYYNPRTGQSLHPDLQHLAPINPHWDWKDSNGVWWRLYRFFRIRR